MALLQVCKEKRQAIEFQLNSARSTGSQMRGRGGAARVAALALSLALCAVPVDALYGEDSAVKLLDGKVPSCARGSCERARRDRGTHTCTSLC